MLDDIVFKNSLKEVYDILKNTENDLVIKIPSSFINFIKENMNKDYVTNIQPNVNINQQPLLKETEAILSLIYQTYWADPSEKKDFNLIKEDYPKEDIYKIFEKRKKANISYEPTSLIPIKKENFIIKFFRNILNRFK